MANVLWTIKNYDREGFGVTAADMTPSATVSNTIKHATARNLQFNLNGIDQLNFSLYLDDPMALQIRRLHSYIKVWRNVYDDSGNQIYADASNRPCFAGVVGSHLKDGDSNIMNISAFSPLWKLQTRFHLLNHYLKTNVDTSADYKQSELLWKLIDLVNNAFSMTVGDLDSQTGIEKGVFSSTNDPVVAPFFVAKGSNTWINFDQIMSRPGGVDIVPVYEHTDGDPMHMIFNTDEKRGEDISGSVSFRYHTGTSDNLDNLTEQEIIVPGEFANYLWAVGAGGPNSGKIALEENVDEDDDSYTDIGVYMRRADFPDIKRVGVSGPPATGLKAIAASEFAQSRVPKTNYACSISPAGGIYYANDFTLGDVVSLNANKGALVVSNVKQRIYDTKLDISDNNVEIATITIADDFTGKIIV